MPPPGRIPGRGIVRAPSAAGVARDLETMHDSGNVGDGDDSGDGNPNRVSSKDDVDAALEAAVKDHAPRTE